MLIRPGTKLCSFACSTEVVVVKAPSAEVDLRCGGQEMTPIRPGANERSSTVNSANDGTQIGKRYIDASGVLEVLCTKGGAGPLSVGDEVLELKPAKPLPASD